MRIMKRVITVGLICVLALSIISCVTVPVTTSNEATTASDTKEVQKQSEEPKKEKEEIKEDKAVEDTAPVNEQPTDTDTTTAKELLDAFVNGEVNADSMYEGKESFSIDDLLNADEEWLKYSEKERRDLDNDDEDELYMDGPYGGMILDARDGKVVILTEGEGTGGVLSYSEYDNAVWICHADTSHGGRQMFFFDKYNGKGEITDSMSLKAEYWESPDDRYDENSIFTFNDENITMQEFEELRHELFPDIPEYNVGEKAGSDLDEKGDSGQSIDDGIYSASLWASEKSRVGTAGIIYQASIEGNELFLQGSLEYRKDGEWTPEPISLSEDITHTFILDDNTVYAASSGEDDDKMTKDEFANYLSGLLDSGLGLDIKVNDGVVTRVSISS